jgi:hypothetical protein
MSRRNEDTTGWTGGVSRKEKERKKFNFLTEISNFLCITEHQSIQENRSVWDKYGARRA